MRISLIHPSTICHWLGHKREYYLTGYYYDRRGRQRERWHRRCVRCGTSDGGEVFQPGRLEWISDLYQDPGRPFRTLRFKVSSWRIHTCSCCGLPDRRFGFRVGDHVECDKIPFWGQ